VTRWRPGVGPKRAERKETVHSRTSQYSPVGNAGAGNPQVQTPGSLPPPLPSTGEKKASAAKNGRIKMHQVFLYLALAVPVLTAIINIGSSQPRMMVSPHDMYQCSGPFSWRYFECGVFGNQSDLLQMSLRGNGLPPWLVRLLDVGNPSPFMATLVFLVIAGVLAVRNAGKSET